MRTLHQTSQKARASVKAAFTLVELLAVMLIIGILAGFLIPKIPEVIDNAQVTACKANMKSIGEGMILYQGKYERLPKKGGVKLFCSLIAEEAWEPIESSTKKLTCPGVQLSALAPDQEGIELKDWYTELDRLDGSWSTYAGRDLKRYPIRKVNGKEILLADDNDGGGNHRTQTVALFGDYAPRTYDIVLEREKGNATKEDEFVVVGPDSWDEDLRKLTLD